MAKDDATKVVDAIGKLAQKWRKQAAEIRHNNIRLDPDTLPPDQQRDYYKHATQANVLDNCAGEVEKELEKVK